MSNEESENSYDKHRRKKQTKRNKKQKYKYSSRTNSDSESSEKRENRYSSSSKSSSEQKEKRFKSHREKDTKEKRIKSNEKEEEPKDSNDNKPKESAKAENIPNFENKEREEINVRKCSKEIKQKKFDKLESKNKNGKFLLEEHSVKEDIKRNVQDIKDITNSFLETKSVIEHYKKEFESKKDFFKEQGYILTKESKERMALLIHYILNGIPVSFEGNTGTSKTRTALTAANYIKKFINEKIEFIRYNLSDETKIDDILSKYVSDSKEITGLKVQDGPYVDAYINGNIILFDEMNLPPLNVLQCIQQSLDNGFISIETNGNCLLKKKKHKNFALIATLNPNKGAFAGKRQELGPEFLSRFQKIHFPDISKSEMEKIAIGIAKNLGYLNQKDKNKEKKEDLLKNIVNIHFEWTKETENLDDIQCFTIREIESVIECLKNKENTYDVLMTIYGGRFKNDIKDKLKNKLIRYNIEPTNKENNLPETFPECFINNSLLQTVNSILLALRNKRNVIIIGKEESGLTQIAEWCSLYFNNKKRKSFTCFCTRNLECTDLIGTQKIGDPSDNCGKLLKFESRFLYDAIKEGNCVVLDSIDEAPPRVIERLNGLLDKKNSEKEKYFDVPENSKNSKIKIHDKFRIICTSNFKKISQISPSFLNRFEVIVLEDQLKAIINEKKIKDFIGFLCLKYHKELFDKHKKNKNEEKEEEKNPLIIGFMKNNKKDFEEKLTDIETIKELIFTKCGILNEGKNPNESNYEAVITEENSKKYLTMSSINKLCRAFIFFKNKFKDMNLDSVSDFSFDLLFEEQLKKPEDETNNYKMIQKKLLHELTVNSREDKKEQNLGEEEYYFDKSESLKSFLVQVYACSLINQHLCIVGPPGIGKTIGARKFSYLREKNPINNESPFYMHTFHQFTRPSDYFGISSLEKEQLVFKDGTLTKSIKKGKVFIGDEFNISSEDCMKAVSPILELKFAQDIIVPGIEGNVSINPDFFFIICQNDKSSFGRKDLPDKIKVKIKVIEYPKRVTEEIKNICLQMYNKLKKDSNERKIGEILSKEEAELCGDFMMKLNDENENKVLTPWSLRDISKLFSRIKKQANKPEGHFKNFGLYENILFYILSSTHDSLADENRVKVVVELIVKTFRIENQNKIKELSELYKSDPKLNVEGNNLFIEKGDIQVFLCKNDPKLFEKLNPLKSLLNGLFKLLITCDDEPILLSGPSSFKTYLAGLLFLNRDKKYQVVSLNSELTISQLIGSPTILTREKEKYYYLTQIYGILQEDNINNLLIDLENFEENYEKIEQQIEKSKIKFMEKKGINDLEEYPFNYALKNFQNKLKEIKCNKKRSSGIDMGIEFKPGIFISSIIKGNNLILKNITNVKTENLERLNEALTGNKKITLNEDIQNSFTPENNKEIKFNDFRIIGTCNEGEETSLSEAFLSRFTLIYIGKYDEEEEKHVLKNWANSENNIEEKDKIEEENTTADIDIKTLNEKLNDYYSKFSDSTKMNLSQKINCIEIARKMGKIVKNDKLYYNNLNLVLYFLLKGLNEKNDNKDEINSYFKINYNNNLYLSPIEVIDDSKIKSTTSNIILNNPQMEINKQDKKEIPKLVFTKEIKEIIDTIHFGISSHTPIILEGSYGQGKKSAIEYYARIAKLEMVLIHISKSTKVDDLLMKTTLKKNEKGNVTLVNSKTPLCEAIEFNRNYPNKLIVLEGINNASPAILEVLNSIYGKKGTNLLLPNGSTIVKGNMNLISIFNPTNDFTRERLPGNLINNSLYLIVNDPSEDDIKDIIYELFKEAGFDTKESQDFFDKFKETRNIALNAEGEFPLTLHEVRKYISFRKSIPDLDSIMIIYFIFRNHFTKNENIYRVEQALKLNKLHFNPIIEYSEIDNKTFLIIKTSKKRERNSLLIEIKHPDRINRNELKQKINSLTSHEKISFLFLLCCVKANKTPIIQGATASGKSFIIKMFAEILGQELNIYQLNSNSGISIFAGQSVMKKGFDETEKRKLNNILKLLNKTDKKLENINQQDFSELKKEIDEKIKSGKLNETEKIEYIFARDTLNKIQSPLNRFEHEDSELIKGLRTGKWVALDGIEMANSQIAEKLSSLCDESPSLNVFESGQDDLNFNSSNIHSEFRLFIIYNSLSKNAKKLDQSLFNKCVKFTLPSVESYPRDVTTILYESIINKIKKPENSDISLWSNLCARIARYHIEKTKETKKNTDLVAGNVPFTSRNLYFISNDFLHFNENENVKELLKIKSWLKSIFDNYYWRSFINYSQEQKEKFIEETKKIIETIPDDQYIIVTEWLEPDQFKEINICLTEIQKFAKSNIEYKEFDFGELLDNCLKVPFNEEKLQNFYNNLEDTILLLDNNFDSDNTKNRFYQIHFIKNSYEKLLNYLKDEGGFQGEFKLIDDELLKKDEITIDLLRMRFLNLILKEKNLDNIYNPNLNYELFTTASNELCITLSNLIKKKDKRSFENLIEFLVNNPEAFKIVHYYYPYDIAELKEGELKNANFYIYYFSLLYWKRINFSIRIKDKRYNITFPEEDQINKYNPYFILNEEKSLNLSRGSLVKENLSEKEFKIIYLEDPPEINTKYMFEFIRLHLVELYIDSSIKNFDNTNDYQLETSNFFIDDESNLVSRILSLVINLTDKYRDVIEYLKNYCCFLERDTIKVFENLYNNLYKYDLNELIKNIQGIPFSLLWKYRTYLNDPEKNEKNLEINKEKIDDELKLLENEVNNLDNLSYFNWDKTIIMNYKKKLWSLKFKLFSIKNKDNENPEITKLRKDSKVLLILLEEKVKNKTNLIKSYNDLKADISNFIVCKEPTKEKYEALKNQLNILIDLTLRKNNKNLDYLNLPNKNDIRIIDTENYMIYDLIFWFSSIEGYLEKLMHKNTHDDTYFKLVTILNQHNELEPIMKFIREKKLEFEGENQYFKDTDKKKVKQMLRGIFILKLKNYKINLDDFNKIVDEINSRINYPDEIPNEEYIFSFLISDIYPKNLKIKIPIFEPIDAFYFFYKYDKENSFKLSEIFKEINNLFGGIKQIALNTLKENDKKIFTNMVDISKYLIKSFYLQICDRDLDENENPNICEFLKNESKKKEANEKELLERIYYAYDFIERFQKKVFDNQNKTNHKFILDDLFNLLDDKYRLMNCSSIFEKEKKFKGIDNTKSLFAPSFMFYINNNKTFINDLFNDINKSDESIISDINNKREIDYLPFWLYILRNITSLNCLEFGQKNINQNIARNIIVKFKNKISKLMKEKKPLDLKWINLLVDNVYYEILDPTIHSFYYFFNSLLRNLNLPKGYLKDFAEEEIEKYFLEIVDYVFNDNIYKELDKDMNGEKKDIFLEFNKDPSSTLFERIKEDINNKSLGIMLIKDKNIYELNEKFIKDFKELSDIFITKIKEANKKLYDEELKKRENIIIEKEYDNINKLYIKYSEDIISLENEAEFTVCQITYNQIQSLNKLRADLLKYDFKEQKTQKLTIYNISYDFTALKNRNYYLYYNNLLIETNPVQHKGNFYLLVKKGGSIYTNNFKLLEKAFDNLSIKGNYSKFPYKQRQELLKNEGIMNQINNIENFVDFNKVFLIYFYKFEKNDENIKNYIRVHSKLTKHLVNPPEILLSNKKVIQFSSDIRNLIRSANNLSTKFTSLKEKKMNESLIQNLEKETNNLLNLLKTVKEMLQLNPNNSNDLIDLSKQVEDSISNYYSLLNEYNENYKETLKEKLNVFFHLNKKNIFILDFALPEIPKNKVRSNIDFEKMNKDYKNLSVPIINTDSEGNNLICCYNPLDINLGQICPALYHKPYIINIISFVNEDLKINIKEKKPQNLVDREEKKEAKEKEKDKEGENPKEEKPLINDDEEAEQKYLSVKEFVKKGDNIQIFVEIPQIFEKNKMLIKSILNIKSSSGKKLELNVNIILTTIPISVLLSCDKYKLIKEEKDNEEKIEIKLDENINYKHYFKLDAKELLGGEEIEFNLLNYKEDDPIEYYVSARSLEKNTSMMPIFSKAKQINNFKLIIPKYELGSKDKKIPILNCSFELLINKYFSIFIEIDSLIKPNLNILKIYDFISKKYVENQLVIYLNESMQKIFKEEKRFIELSCILFSNFEGETFNIKPEPFEGGVIHSYQGKIEQNKCEFSLLLEFEDEKNKIIRNNSDCIINIFINKESNSFKIVFLEPKINLDSDDVYSKFIIKGRNSLNDNWRQVYKKEELTDFYVTPFNYLQMIDYKKLPYLTENINFYYMDKNGKIACFNQLESKKTEKYYFFNVFNYSSKEYYPFCFCYKDLWYPLVQNGRKINKFNYLHFENYTDIKKKINNNYYEWENEIKSLNNVFEEISRIKKNKGDYYLKSNEFYETCEEIYNNNVTQILNSFLNEIEASKESSNITFELLAYHMIWDINFVKELHKIFPQSIKRQLNQYFINYNKAKEREERILAAYNYILKFQEIFDKKEKEFNQRKKKIEFITPDLLEEQKNLLFNFYSIEQPSRSEQLPNIIQTYDKKKVMSFKNTIIDKEKKSYKKFLIVADESKNAEENEKQSIEKSDIKVIIKMDNSTPMQLPKIDLEKYQQNLSLNNILELYNNIIIGSRIFPAYLHSTVIQNKKEDLEYSSQYFDILFSIYKNNKGKIKNNNSLIYIKLNEFISSFEDMVIKLKNAGVVFIHYNELNSIKNESHNSNSFITLPSKIETERQNDDWNYEKLLKQKKQANYSRENNFNFELSLSKGNINTRHDKIERSDENPISPDEPPTTKTSQPEESEESDEDKNNILIPMEKPDEPKYNNIDEKNMAPINFEFQISEKGKEKTNTTKDRETFENIEKQYNEDFSLNYTVGKMKNNKYDTFRYESPKTKELKHDFLKNIKEVLKDPGDCEIKEGEKLPILELIEKSRFLTAKIYSTVASLNYNETEKEIPFNKVEAHILVDVARTISIENRYFNMLLICGLVTALNYLKIPYSLSLIGDSNFQINLKPVGESPNELFLQKLYDCCFIKRNITQLAYCLKYFIDKYPPKDESTNRVYYIFSNGYDYELIKYNAWKRNIFNEEKNSFSFIFLKSQAKNVENKKFLEKIWDNFNESNKSAQSYTTLTKVSIEEFNDLAKQKDFIENVSNVLLRKVNNDNKNKANKYKSLFKVDKDEISKSSKLTEKYIGSLLQSLRKPLTKFNDLYIKRNKMPLIYDNQKDDKKEFKNFCLQTGKIILYEKVDNNIQGHIMTLAKEFIEKGEKKILAPMNIIFKPNLPTQSVLVEEGTHLDITALIQYLINKVPNPKLYREIRDGFVKNYGVSVIIDGSISCLNELCLIHTIQTLRVLLSALSHDNIPCLDVIISREKEPLILASEKSANEILMESSPFWAVLFSYLGGEPSSDLASAIKSAYNLNRARRKEYTNYIFVLTDGLYSFSERDRIIEVVNSCLSKNINVFGIGVGINPNGIEKIFSQVVYAQNPYKLIEGISLFFGDISNYEKKEMQTFDIGETEKINKLIKNSDEIKKDIRNPKFKRLKEELFKIVIPLESFSFNNKELPPKDGLNPEGEGMYKRNLYKGQKILFAMFFSCDLKTQQGEPNSTEEQKVHPKNIKRNYTIFDNEESISSVLDYYGYEIVVVTGYEDAIKELCKKDYNNRCIYNSLWVLSGKEVPDLPRYKGDIKSFSKDENDPYYVEQFAECAIKFWKNGGSLVLMAENDPYTFQVNLILKKLVFPGRKKVKFQIGGSHKGGQILEPDYTGKLDKNKKFHKKHTEVSNHVRNYLSFDLYQIFEGLTVSYTYGGSIEPFIPFSRDSEGGINSLFYNGSDNGDGEGEGDIVIDCGYTKFFLKMKEHGTWRYLQNIGGFIGSAERRHKIYPQNPGYYRPKGFNFSLDKNPELHYNYRKTPFDVVYLVDATDSMRGSIDKVKTYCGDIAEILEKDKLYDFKFGAVFYKDPVDTKKDENKYWDLTDNMFALQNFVSGIIVGGGGDIPEDWVGGYDLALHQMHWRNGHKLIIHITDAGAHGTEYSRGDKIIHRGEGEKLDKLINECIGNNISIAAFQIENEQAKQEKEYISKQSFDRVKMFYERSGKAKYFKSETFEQNKKSKNYFTGLVVETITKVTK